MKPWAYAKAEGLLFKRGVGRKSDRRGKPQLADEVCVSIFLTVRLGRSDAEVEWCILSGIVRRT